MDLANTPHTLLLPISPKAWAPPERGVTVDGITFLPKAELHVTLIGSQLGRELHATFAAHFLRAYLDGAFSSRDWQFVPGGPLLLLAQRVRDRETPDAGEFSRASIIELIQLPAMQSFHRELGRLLGRQLAVPPPHVTLFTANDPRGISVSSPERLRALTVREVDPGAISHHR